MNLNTIVALHQPNSAAEIAEWREGFAWLAGGTSLFSEPRPSNSASQNGSPTLSISTGVCTPRPNRNTTGYSSSRKDHVLLPNRLRGPADCRREPLFETAAHRAGVKLFEKRPRLFEQPLPLRRIRATPADCARYRSAESPASCPGRRRSAARTGSPENPVLGPALSRCAAPRRKTPPPGPA